MAAARPQVYQAAMRPFVYILFYKPYQVLCQFSPEGSKTTLAAYLSVAKDVYPIGRLDYDSEGLLLLTNDPAVNQRLLQPGQGQAKEKEYYVQVEGSISREALATLSNGVQISIDGKPHLTLPAKARLLEPAPLLPPRNPPIRYRASIPTSWISLTLQEGKNRQVRRMTAAVGYPTLRLLRWRIGKHTLQGMQPGDWVAVSHL